MTRYPEGTATALEASLAPGQVPQDAIREAVAVRVSPMWKELRELWLRGKVADE